MSRPLIAALIVVLTGIAPAQNLLVNPGFDAGTFAGWSTFGNVFNEFTVPPQFVPNSGTNLASVFGNFSGSFNASGLFQTFPAVEGDVFEMDCFTRHFSGDPMIGGGSPTGDNFAVMKIVFRDIANTEIGAVERVVLDGTFATDVWHNNLPIQGKAPVGTVNVEAFLLYLQPAFAGGAAHFDDVSLVQLPIGLFITQDATSLDTTVEISGALPFAQYGIFYSADPQNGIFPGFGTFGGLFISLPDLTFQINASLSSVPLFGGALDANGRVAVTLPGSVVTGLSGLTLWGVGAQINNSAMIDFSNISSITFL